MANRTVPLGMSLVRFYFDVLHLRVGDLLALLVFSGVKLGLYTKTSFGPRGTNQVDDNFRNWSPVCLASSF